MRTKLLTLAAAAGASVATLVACSTPSLMSANPSADARYSGFPVTVPNYTGDATSSVSYSGQVARHVLHNSLKSLSGKGDGSNATALRAEMLRYYESEEAGRAVLSPTSKDGFAIKQTEIDELSKGKNLAGKAYKGTVTGWPGAMSGDEVIRFMIDKAAASEGGYDPLTGYDYTQLISKFLMGAVFYNQAVDNYLDEKLAADNKPNNEPYSEGSAYTGKEHVWDEAFGYFGAPANGMSLSAEEAYNIAKGKPEVFAKADANGDGVIDLKTEMTYAHAYYAADADKSGKSDYLHTITGAFINGRALIASAKGEALSDSERQKLREYADIIASNWERVLAEATFKYAGSVYKDIQALQSAMDENGDVQKAFRTYAKHWGEMKGFALALQTGKSNLGEVATRLNKLMGYSPMLLGNTQITGIDANGEYQQAPSSSLDEYALHMLKVQDLLASNFELSARKNDLLGELGSVLEKLGGAGAETD